MTALAWLKQLPRPWSHERQQPASHSDLRRWLERGSVSMNYRRPKPYDELGDFLDEVTFFPTKPGRVTLWDRAVMESWPLETADAPAAADARTATAAGTVSSMTAGVSGETNADPGGAGR